MADESVEHAPWAETPDGAIRRFRWTVDFHRGQIDKLAAAEGEITRRIFAERPRGERLALYGWRSKFRLWRENHEREIERTKRHSLESHGVDLDGNPSRARGAQKAARARRIEELLTLRASNPAAKRGWPYRKLADEVNVNSASWPDIKPITDSGVRAIASGKAR